jgi:hypothetical protein
MSRGHRPIRFEKLFEIVRVRHNVIIKVFNKQIGRIRWFGCFWYPLRYDYLERRLRRRLCWRLNLLGDIWNLAHNDR